MVAAETLGLPIGAVALKIGDSSLAAFRSIGRIDHGRRRFLLHAQVGGKRVGEIVRRRGAVARNYAPINS